MIATSFVATAGEVSSQTWDADLSSPAGLLDILTAVLQRHPELSFRRRPYRRSFVDVLRDGAQLSARLNGSSFEVGPQISLSLDGGTHQDRVVDEATLVTFKDELRRALARVRSLNFEPGDLSRDVEATARAWSAKDKRALLTLMPLIYDAEGSADDWPSIGARVAGVDAELLAELYTDFTRNYIEPKLAVSAARAGLGDWAQLQLSISKKFTDLAARLHKTTTSVAGVRPIFLEEVPKLIATLRGAIGYDCSMSSVPMHALSRGTRVFWIKKSARGPARGYLLMAEARFSSVVIPYVITINGSTLSAADGRTALLQIAHLYKSPVVLLPKEQVTVNTTPMRRALYFDDPRAQDVAVEMPGDWDIIDAAPRGGFRNYYARGTLESARLLALDGGELDRAARTRVHGAAQTYLAPPDPRLQSRINRVRLATAFSLGHDGNDTIYDLLDIPAGERTDYESFLHRLHLAEEYPRSRRGLGADVFARNLVRAGYPLPDLLRDLSLVDRVYVLGKVSDVLLDEGLVDEGELFRLRLRLIENLTVTTSPLIWDVFAGLLRTKTPHLAAEADRHIASAGDDLLELWVESSRRSGAGSSADQPYGIELALAARLDGLDPAQVRRFIDLNGAKTSLAVQHFVGRLVRSPLAEERARGLQLLGTTPGRRQRWPTRFILSLGPSIADIENGDRFLRTYFEKSNAGERAFEGHVDEIMALPSSTYKRQLVQIILDRKTWPPDLWSHLKTLWTDPLNRIGIEHGLRRHAKKKRLARKARHLLHGLKRDTPGPPASCGNALTFANRE